MVKISRIGPGGTRLTSQSGVAPRNVASEMQVGRAVSNLGKTMQGVAQKFEDIYWKNKKDEVALAIYDGVTTLDAEAKIDENIDNPTKQAEYNGKMQSLREKVMTDIPNGAVKSEIGNMLDLETLKFKFGIKAYGRTMLMHKRIANTKETLQKMGKEYIATDPTLRPEMFDAMIKRIDDLESEGFILPERAVDWKKKSKESWNKQAALYDADVYGIDYVKNHMGDYDVEDKAGLLKELHAAKKLEDARKEKARIDLQNDTIREQIAKQGKDEFEPQDAEDLYQSEIIDLKTRDDLLKRYYEVDVNTDYAEYNRLYDRVNKLNNLDGQSDTDKKEIIRDILATKNLEPTKREELIDKAYAISDTRDKNTILNEGKGVEAWATQVIGEHEVVEMFKGEIKGQIDELVYKFYNRVNAEQAKGERIGEIAQEIRDEYIKNKYPELTDVDVIPDVVVPVKGQVQRLKSFGGKKSDKKAKPKFKTTRTNDSLSGKDKS